MPGYTHTGRVPRPGSQPQFEYVRIFMSVYLYLPIRKHFITLAIKSNDNVVPYLLSSPGWDQRVYHCSRWHKVTWKFV